MVLVIIKAKTEILDALERARGMDLSDPDANDSDWHDLEQYLMSLPGDWVAVVRTPPDGDENLRQPQIRYLSLEDLAASSGFTAAAINH